MPHRIATRTEGPAPDSRLPHPGPWLLDDQAHAASAFLAAFEHTGDGRWLDRARELVDMTLAFYWDDDEGGFFDAREQTGGFLATRAKPIQDAPTASPNATAAIVLLRLAALSGEEKYRGRARLLLEAFAGTAADLGIHGATWLRALDWLLNGECQIEVADDLERHLHREALRHYRPRKVVLPRRGSPVPGTPPPVALVCADTTCAAPVHDSGALRKLLEHFGREAGGAS